MGYIAISSYIYVDYFRLSEQAYSYFFAANALVSILGPIIYVRYLTNVSKMFFPIVCFALGLLGGILIMSVGKLSPIIFLVSFMIMSVTFTATRPFSTNLLFEQQKGDTGSASSVINTLFTVLGSIGMSVASMPWGNMIVALGIIITIFSCVPLIGWYMFMKSSIPCIGLKYDQEAGKV
jgi:DHA1 family bicyclomycin/chloramphenicol resistance-like MFS transporter